MLIIHHKELLGVSEHGVCVSFPKLEIFENWPSLEFLVYSDAPGDKV